MTLRIVVPPSQEQITLTEARLHLRLDDDGDSPASHPDDAWLSSVGIPAAREYCEGWLGRALAPQTVELVLDSFDDVVEWTSSCRCWRWPYRNGEIALPMVPIASVESVKYYDGSGVFQTMSSGAYHVDEYGGRLVLVDGTSWPTTQVRPNAVRVRYQVGYNLSYDSPLTNPLPAALKAAMLLVLGALYENREDQAEKKLEMIPLGARSLMEPYRVRLGIA